MKRQGKFCICVSRPYCGDEAGLAIDDETELNWIPHSGQPVNRRMARSPVLGTLWPKGHVLSVGFKAVSKLKYSPSFDYLV